MREILFRAKRIDNGEWVEGYIVKLGRESFSDPERYGICNKAIPLGGSGVCYNLKVYEIIPETMGQYTGLTDKNGKKIFEGDILEGLCGLNKVYFDTDSACFDWENISGQLKESFSIFAYDYEIICNIHDNPELLKGGDDE